MPGIALGLAIDVPRRGMRGTSFRFDGGAMPPGAVFTRASAATTIDASGTVASVAANVPRFAPGTPGGEASAGLIIEESRKNFVSRSAPIATPIWTLFGGATVGSATAAPDGSNEGRVLNLPGGGAIYISLAGLTPGANYVVSVWARRPASGGASHVRIASNDASAWNTGASARFALTTAWQRISLAAPIGTGTIGSVVLGATDAAGAQDATCSGDVELWGVQVEQGAAATSLFPTTGAVATRAADVLTLNWSALGIADGVRAVRYTFDDGSIQDKATTIDGGSAPVPVPLARTVLRSARVL